jgi:hypothetical protein
MVVGSAARLQGVSMKSSGGNVGARRSRKVASLERLEARSLMSTTIYVDANATGLADGSSWQDAYQNLQQALASAGAGTEIHLADGTYYPSTSGDKSASFQMKNGVALRGGYAGVGAADPNARDTVLHPSVLSGFLGTGVNSDDVVCGDGADATAVLDGVTVTGGHGVSFFGGGMRIVTGSPTITGCTFLANGTWNAGGGIYINGGSPAISDCRFVFNGGGIYAINGSVHITRCAFESNSSDGGAALYVEKSTLSVDNSSFVNDQVLGAPSDVFGSESSMNFRNCVFLYESSASCSLLSSDTDTTISNCTFAPFNPNSTTPTVAVKSYTNSHTDIYNSIVWGKASDTSSQVWSDATSVTSISYSDIKGGWTGATRGANISVDPQFLHLGAAPTIDEMIANLKLKPASPCIDAALDSLAPSGAFGKDFSGGPRIIDSPGVGTSTMRVDMGAFEAPPGFGPDFGGMTPLNYNQVITLHFANDQLLQSSLQAGELQLTNITTGQTFDLSNISAMRFFTTSVTWDLSVILPDGNYTALLPAGSVQDLSGTAYAHDFSFSFFALAGDANHDRIVDIRDLSVLATNWGKANQIFAQGDFNYDGTVDAKDLGILSMHWQMSLPAPAPTIPTASRAPTRTAVRVIELI